MPLSLEILAATINLAGMIVAHLSDLHLGKKTPGDANGSLRLHSFRRAIETLAAHKPDVLLIAGDMFDTPTLDPAIIEEAARGLEKAKYEGTPIPVVVIPGNHDPADQVRLWSTFRKALVTRVHLALEPEVIAIGDSLVIQAYPCPTRFSPAPPWERRLQKPAGSAACVVVAHGTLQGGPVPEDEGDAYPFTLAEVESLGADYVALGHFHGVYPPWNDSEEIERSLCYCGTHEPDQFTGDAGYAILAEIHKGRPTRLRRVKVSRREWRLLEIHVPADIARVEKMREEIAADEPARFVIRLRVGARARLTLAENQALDRLAGTLTALGAHVERRGEGKAPLDLQTFDLAELPSGAVKEALISFQDELGQADENRRELLAAALQLGCEKVKDAMES